MTESPISDSQAPSGPAPESLLIVLFGAIGDVTRALPLAMRIRKGWPDTRVSWAIEPKSAGLLENHPAVDRMVIFHRELGFRGYLKFLGELRAERYDVVLDLQRHLKSGFTSWASRGKKRVGFHPKNTKELNWLWNNYRIPKESPGMWKLAHYQRFADVLGVPPSERFDSGFLFDHGEIHRAEETVSKALRGGGFQDEVPPERRVAFIVGASWQSKLWPHDKYLTLARELWQRFGMVSFLVGGAGETVTASRMMNSASGTPVISLVGKTSLRELGALFSRMRMAVGSDSGPMHIAAAVGIPAISLWGASDPSRNAPLGSESLVLQSAIGCSPCLRRKCPGLENICMSDIPPDAVLARIQTVLGG